MSDYIKRNVALDAMRDVMKQAKHLRPPLYDAIDAVKNLPRLELSDILKDAHICGYDFKDLVTFADACKRQGITEQDMSDFCKNAGDAYRYVLDMVQEQTNKAVAEMAMNCGIKGSNDYEQEIINARRGEE